MYGKVAKMRAAQVRSDTERNESVLAAGAAGRILSFEVISRVSTDGCVVAKRQRARRENSSVRWLVRGSCGD